MDHRLDPNERLPHPITVKQLAAIVSAIRPIARGRKCDGINKARGTAVLKAHEAKNSLERLGLRCQFQGQAAGAAADNPGTAAELAVARRMDAGGSFFRQINAKAASTDAGRPPR